MEIGVLCEVETHFICFIHINFILQIAIFTQIKSNHQLREMEQGRRRNDDINKEEKVNTTGKSVDRTEDKQCTYNVILWHDRLMFIPPRLPQQPDNI
jgi:hypothetical protein